MTSPHAAHPPHSRPTNNQLLYKAHFRWKHYTAPLTEECSLPVATGTSCVVGAVNTDCLRCRRRLCLCCRRCLCLRCRRRRRWYRDTEYYRPHNPDLADAQRPTPSTRAEPCASVTSAFLQILATIHNVEACRVSNPRNILSILSTNTRRTKVVEMSTGTHRVVRCSCPPRCCIHISLHISLRISHPTRVITRRQCANAGGRPASALAVGRPRRPLRDQPGQEPVRLRQ